MRDITKSLVEESIDKIKEIYLLNEDPFLIGFSGGKDSTLTLDLVLNSLEEIYQENPKKITKPTYIISSDTLIENPFVVKRIDELEDFIRSGKVDHLKINFIRAQPDINESFWTLIIGRGYPLPLNRFRWCTRHLKIKPMELASYEIQAKHKNIVNVLGIRRSESNIRRKKMEVSETEDQSFLFKNFEEERNIIFAPIQKFDIKELWDYMLSKEKSYWNSNFKILYQMYQDSSKECVTSFDMSVVANKADSCGNSRWGCWVCPLSNNIWIDNMFFNGILDLEEVVSFRKTLLYERDLLENRYIGKHIRSRSGKISLGIRGLQKLKFDEITNTFYRPAKGNSRERIDVVINNQLVNDYQIIEENQIKEISKEILYNDKDGANLKYAVKKPYNGYFIFAPGPYTLTYRINLLEKLVRLKNVMDNKTIKAGTEEAVISVISKEEYDLIKSLLLDYSQAISSKKFKSTKSKLEKIDELWS
ncbi:DNA sulfur modification protein DndC [Spiroplasma helicoides]|uniref:DNA sulfur modification protein DndC n=1 Tax=Spiroplasma helicoides TaxID=216938 RepID=A0A1B3SKE0_9MOLU|nr:phosphoadenosine phosphosulfate reductase family protein [Spiroplasma helicoides]AOG60391.1 DNA sulfur modification protein DndC [Spiroplasma helicoides]